MSERIKSQILVDSGLAAMRRAGKLLTRVPATGRAMVYSMANGESVRMRTCNDHVLIVVSETPAPDAKLNIQGTDWLLLVMPEVERTPGRTVCYLVPTREAEAEIRRTHAEWLGGNPKTKGDNRTWTLWFKKDAPTNANDYATKWAKFRLDVSVVASEARTPVNGGRRSDVKAEVDEARRRIANAAGVPVEAVKITINFGD